MQYKIEYIFELKRLRNSENKIIIIWRKRNNNNNLYLKFNTHIYLM